MTEIILFKHPSSTRSSKNIKQIVQPSSELKRCKSQITAPETSDKENSDGVEREVLMEEGTCRTSVDTPVPNNELPYAEGQKAGRRQKIEKGKEDDGRGRSRGGLFGIRRRGGERKKEGKLRYTSRNREEEEEGGGRWRKGTKG